MTAATEAAITEAFRQTGVEPDVWRALFLTESGGKPFDTRLSATWPTWRVEAHKLPIGLRAPLGLPAQMTWRDALKMSKRRLLEVYKGALRLDREAAHRATSYGVGQVMGFNHALAGYPSATAMFEALRDAAKQVEAAVAYAKNRGLLPALRARDWMAVASGYNGTGKPAEYARVIEGHYRRLTGHASPVVLRQGATGRSVEELQRALARLGLYDREDIDGVFGPATAAAVRRFQAEASLPVDGVVGARTWAALAASATVAPEAQPAPTPAIDVTETAGKIAAGAAAATAAAKSVAEALGGIGALLPEEVAAALPWGVAIGLGAGLALWGATAALRYWRGRVAA